MNTQEVVDCHVKAVVSADGEAPALTVALPALVEHYREHAEQIALRLPTGCLPGEDLKSDAMMKILVRAFLARVRSLGDQNWDREHVRSTYGAEWDGCSYIYYPASNAERLIVHFSSMGKDRFDRYSHYWDPTQKWEGCAAHLFFKDDAHHYFLGTDAHPMSAVYGRIIRHFQSANHLGQHQTFAVGGSMGGYAALYYALSLGLGGAVVCAPQVTLRALQAHNRGNWLRNALATGTQWTDIDMLVHRCTTIPSIYLECGTYPADKLAADALIEALSSKSGVFVHRRARWTEHTQDTVLDKSLVDRTIQYFELNRSLDQHYQDPN